MSNDTSYQRPAQEEECRAAELRQATKAALFDALRSAGISRVTVTFDGASDEGQIEFIEAVAARNKPLDLPDARVTVKTANHDGTALEEATPTLTEAITDLCYDLLAENYGSWGDNDGAFGKFVFHVARRRLSLTFNARFTDFETETATF